MTSSPETGSSQPLDGIRQKAELLKKLGGRETSIEGTPEGVVEAEDIAQILEGMVGQVERVTPVVKDNTERTDLLRAELGIEGDPVH